MPDSINGFYVTLIENLSLDESEAVINAIRMIKGVSTVEQNTESCQDYFAKQQLKIKIRGDLYDFVEDKLK